MRQGFYTHAVVLCCILCVSLIILLPPCRGEDGSPDLVISGYGKFAEDNPWLQMRDVVAPGDTVIYSITITNQGDINYDGAITVRALDLPNGWQAEISTVQTALPPYDQGQASYTTKVPIGIPQDAAPGKYSANFFIAPVQGEKITSNNIHKIPINILPPQPDLSIVDIHWKPLDFSVFDRPEIEVVLRNQGTADSEASKLEVEVQIGSEKYTTHLEAEVPGLKQGETWTWKCEKILGTGMFSHRYDRNVIKATVNPDQKLVEHNYLNNERETYIVVREGPLHAELDWQPHNPTAQDEIDFIFTVANEGDVRWVFPDYRRDGRGSTITLRYWPVGNFGAAKTVEDSIWVLGARKSRTYHFRARIPEPGEYRITCEIYAGFPYWIVAQTPEESLIVAAP